MITKDCFTNSFFFLLCTVILFQACTKPIDPLKFAGSRNEKIYPQKIDTIMAMSGINKVQLKIPKPTDPQVQSIGIFWNLGDDSLKASFGKSDTLIVNIDHIDQKSFSFNIYTYDQNGNKSVAFTRSVPVYGIEYLSHITNRPVNFIINKTDSNMVIINWGSLSDTTAIGTEVRFKNINNQMDSIFIPDDTLAVNQITIIPNAAKQPSIWTQTLYYPPASLDTFRLDYSEVSDSLILDISKPSGEGSQSDPFKVNSFGNLVWITQNSNSWDKYYAQTADIDATGSKNPFFGGKGFIPIALGSQFTGHYDGGNYSVSNLTINNKSLNNVGLFSQISGSNTVVKNVHLKNIDYNGGEFVGGITGQALDSSAILNVSVSGSIAGQVWNIAGIVGRAVNATIKNSYNAANISSTSKNDFGGIVGICEPCFIKNVYNTGEVSGSGRRGGIAGQIKNGGTIKNAYNVGVIQNSSGAIVGKIDKTSSVGNCYFLINTAENSNIGLGVTKDSMMAQASFVGFDFNGIWAIDEGASYPYLRDNEQIPHPGK